MDEAERTRMRAEILADLAPLFEEKLASREWGRALVQMIPRPNGSFRVGSIDVEDVVGDHEAIDRAMGSEGMRELLPLLERATLALVGTHDLELADVEGGTYLRREDGSLGFLPGMVHAPSDSFAREADGARAFLAEGKQRLAEAAAGATRFDVDLDKGALRFLDGDAEVMTARAVVLCSFARQTRAFTWAWQNPSLDEAVKEPSRALCDLVPFRDMWELTTPTFASDEATAWTIASIVAKSAGSLAVQDVQRADGFVLLALTDLRRLSRNPA
jgi:hypothetical protein